MVGAASNYDTDRPGQIRRVFGMAREFDVAIDMHLDSGASAEELDTLLICDLTEEYGWAGASPSGTSASSPPCASRIRTRWRAGWPIQAWR